MQFNQAKKRTFTLLLAASRRRGGWRRAPGPRPLFFRRATHALALLRRRPAAVAAADLLDHPDHVGGVGPRVGDRGHARHGHLQQRDHLLLGAGAQPHELDVEHLGGPLLPHHGLHPPGQVQRAVALQRRVRGGLARQELQQEHAQGVDVRLERQPPRVHHLRGAVPAGPRRRRREQLVQAEVGQRRGVGVRAEQDVGGLHVAVHQVVHRVQLRQPASGGQRGPHARLPVQRRPTRAPAPCAWMHKTPVRKLMDMAN
ncbi:hypothetical protein BDA96_03G232600 [Sorghum bicolor]|uniref:Uncharacterized protein n=1 Tax=Sorghum bicolor TaxID=4558 RepID=A0A921RF45_SORBI|nr:hypothetical protein BDA96_03G232600 [Sorghum bicolor]